MSSEASDLNALFQDLDRLRRLLVSAGDKHWPSILQSIAVRIWSPENRDAALTELKRYFGGMGSLNDIVFCDVNQNIPPGYTGDAATRELDELLDRIFRRLCLFGASAADRAAWVVQEKESVLRPRILNSFRGRRE